MILFQDTITGYHLKTERQADGSTQNTRESDPFVSGISCQLSFNGDDNAGKETAQRLPQRRGLKAFVWLFNIPEGQAFRRGDFIRITRTSNGDPVAIYEGTIGEPRIYPRGIPHVEISLDAYKYIQGET